MSTSRWVEVMSRRTQMSIHINIGTKTTVLVMLLKILPLLRISRRFVNALYEPGNKAVLTPVLNIDERLSDRTKLLDNVTRRKCTPSIDVNDLYAQWEIYKSVQSAKKAIETRQEQLVRLFRDLSKVAASPEKENSIRKYKLEGIALREDSRNLRDNSYTMESRFIGTFLAIPNDIHHNTADTATLIASTKDIGQTEGERGSFHLDYESQIEYYGASAFYLKDNAAKFDLHFPLHCVDFFRALSFVQFSNPDFAKTILIEGGAVPLDEVYEVRHTTHETCSNLLHLVGGGSMLSYLGFVAKLRVYETQLPLRWIATGKEYIPKFGNSGMGLFDVCQSTCVQTFLAGKQEQMDEEFNKTVGYMHQLYESLGVHFRIIRAAAHELKSAECMCVRFEMYSPYLQRYIEVGQLSHFSDYISKRILFNYDNKTKYPHVVAGTVCNVTKILAILLECNGGQINEVFRKKL